MELKTGYKQTEIGVIPEDWEVKTLGELAIIGSGGTPSRKNTNYWNGTIPWITTSQIDFNTIADAEQFITDEGLNNSAAKLLPANTLLLALYGQGKTRGKVARLGIDAATNQACASISITENLSSDYLLCFLTSKYETIRNFSNGGSQDNLNGQIVKQIPVLLPPLPEQTAIAAALSDVDALMGKLDKLIAKKRDIKQATMQQLLTGKKRLAGFSGEWEVKRLGDVIDKIVGGGTPSRSNPDYWGNDIPWVTVKDFATFNPYQAQEAVTHEGLKHSASHLIPKETLITSTRMALGKAVIYKVDVCINQDLKALFPKSCVDNKFLYYWFERNASFIDELGSGSTVKGISLVDLKKITFHLFSIEEQTAIATILSDMDAEINALQQKRDKTTQLKQGMMQELLTGRIRLVSNENLLNHT